MYLLQQMILSMEIMQTHLYILMDCYYYTDMITSSASKEL